MSQVCVRGDVAGGAIMASAATTIGGVPVALRGDAVASHPPCPRVPVHCSASMTASPSTNINGVPIVIQGDSATCGHGAVSSTGVTITVTPVDPDVPPGRVSAPTVTPVTGALAVSWDAVQLADSYKVQWKSGDQDWDAARQAVVTGTSWTIPDLVIGTEYTVRVIATRATAGDGAPSAAVTGTPRADEAILTAPGSAYVAAPGFLVSWNGTFGALPPAWGAPGADLRLLSVRIDAAVLGGALQIDIGRGRNDLLADVRGEISLTIATEFGSVTVSGIGGADTSEPYSWVPDNSAALQTFFNAISSRRNVAATFTFTRG